MSCPVVVFVHGIRSDCECFDALRRSIVADKKRFSSWRLEALNYDWELGVQAGASRLLDRLRLMAELCGSHGISVIAHSMGGLVARSAIMDDPTLPIRRLIMLATPNFGAISTAQQGSFWQIVFGSATGVLGIYPRLRAYYDLMHVHELMTGYREKGIVVDFDYLTMPGQFYHHERGLVERLNFMKGKRTYVIPAMAAELLGTVFPLRLKLDRPHDGIVESNSVSLSPAEGARWSEKRASVRSDKVPISYVNIVHDKAIDLDHGTILTSPAIIELVTELLLSESIGAWLPNADPSKYAVDCGPRTKTTI